MSNKSSIEWFAEQTLNAFITKEKYDELFNQAKEMHKQEVLDAWEDGRGSFPTRNEEEYYDKTFGK